MCGRYASAEDPNSLIEFFEAVDATEAPLPDNYNVAPTQPVYVVDEVSGPRQLRVVNWGLVPSWAKDASLAGKLINARAETVAEKPSFRGPFAKTRCLVPATGWYEWKTVDAEPKVKRPFYLTRVDGAPVAMAGLLEAWKHPDTGQWLRTVAVITTENCVELAPIHDRMPVILERAEWSQWLDPNAGELDLLSLLNPTEPGTVQAWEVSQAVNSIRNGGPELIRPLEQSGDILR